MSYHFNKKETVGFLRKWSIEKRLRTAFIFTTIIPLFLLGIFCAFSYQKEMNEKLTDTFVQTLWGLNKTIDVTMGKYLTYSYPIITSDDVNKILNNEDVSGKKGTIDELVQENGVEIYLWIESCDNIILYNNSIERISSMNGANPENSSFVSVIKELGTSDSNHGWYFVKNDMGQNALAFVKKIYSKSKRGEQIGYLAFLFSEKRLFRPIYEGVNIGDDTDIFIIDKNGIYLSSKNDKGKIGKNIQKDLSEVKLKNWAKSGYFTEKYQGKKCLIVYQYNRTMDAFLTAVVEVSYINQGIAHMVVALGGVIIFIIILCRIIISAINDSIVYPISDLLAFTNAVSQGNYHEEVVDGSEDEMGKLTNYVYEMVKRLVWYMEKIEMEGKEKRKLEIQNLQYQIQPHFLFNTLNTFKYIAIINNVESLGEGIGALCSLLRNTVNIKDEMILLSEEITNVSNYICIQEFRYTGGLDIHYQITEDAGKEYVPRLLLQPLVENSIVHGMKTDMALSIWIRAFVEGDKLYIYVEDNGIGFVLQDRVKKKQTFSGIGLENIKERIQLIYRGKGEFKLESEIEVGIRIMISIPVGREKNV